MHNFNNQKGITHLLLLAVLGLGLAAGIYLVQQQTNIFPKAFVPRSSRPISRAIPLSPRPSATPCSAPNCFRTTPPSPKPSPIVSKRVFVTSTTYNGNLGGLSGADAKCQDRAKAANLGGAWKAWLSYGWGSDSASSRLLHANGPYLRLDNKAVANNWTDLVDGTLLNSISLDEFGKSVTYPSNPNVWTNTTFEGMSFGSDNTCSGFTTTSGNVYEFGQVGSTSSWWTAISGTAPCSTQMRLYCFEQ